MEDKKFDPSKRHKLNNPERLNILDPEKIISFLDLQDPERVIDIGAGTAFITMALADQLPDVKIDAFDIEPVMIKTMEEDLPSDSNITPILMEEGKLTAEDNSVDAALMINLYHELKRPYKLLREVKRVLKPGGKLLIIDWAKKPEACDAGPPFEHRVEEGTITSHLIETDYSNIMTSEDFEIYSVIVAQK